MKKVLLACSGALAMVLAACGPADTGQPTGTAGSSGGTTAGVAGTTGAGGDGVGGTTGDAGSGAGGTVGNAGTGGSSSTAGNNGSTAGTGGGMAGNNATAGTGGSTAGRGGASATAGTGGSTAGRGGSTGGSAAGTGGGTGGAIEPSTIVPGLDGYYWEMSPSGNTSLTGTNYPFGAPAGGCPTGANWDTTGYIQMKPAIPVMGTSGQRYTINISVRGVTGTRCYTGGTPASTAAGNPSGPNNTWYVGGRQYNDSIWNTMELRVMPPIMPRASVQTNSGYDIYYTNSFQNTSNWCQKEATYEVRYNASIPVTGGGSITPVVHDSNCRTLQNCGSAEAQASCNAGAARIIDMTGLNPPATAPGGGNFSQPRTGALGGTTYYLQWIWIDVTSVTSP